MADETDGSETIGGTEMSEEQDEEEDIYSNFTDGQLSCLGQDIEEIPQSLIDNYSKVTRRLDLSFNRIKNVAGLAEFPNLEELVLDNNELTDTRGFPPLLQLHTLTLNKNRLSDLEQTLTDIQSKFPNLTYLSLLGNTACPNELSAHDKGDEDYARYRYTVLYRLQLLKFLDSSSVTASDLQEAQRVGPYTTVVRGTGSEVVEPAEKPPSPLYSPLPDNVRESDDHQGTFGKSRYVYYGKHSEGNRFIRNTDL